MKTFLILVAFAIYAEASNCGEELSKVKGLFGEFRPKCLDNGDWAPKQCKEAYCWCVNEEGTKLTGSFPYMKELNCDQYRNPTCDDPNSTYNQCGTACPEGCDNLGKMRMCNMMCVQGCFCNAGYLLQNSKDKNSPCVKKESCGTSCVNKLGEFNGLFGEYRPTCLDNGDWAPKQTKGAYSWCVNSQGERLTESVAVCEKELDCESNCRVALANIKGLFGEFRPKCLENGDWAPKQTKGAYSWCVNSQGERLTELVAVYEKELDCESNCRVALANFKGLFGEFRPKCLENGDWAPKQCHEAFCWCVNADGEKLTEATAVYEKELNCGGESDSLTHCQSARIEALKNMMPGKYVPQCDSNGAYSERQCNGSTRYCWCVDTTTGQRYKSGPKSRAFLNGSNGPC